VQLLADPGEPSAAAAELQAADPSVPVPLRCLPLPIIWSRSYGHPGQPSRRNSCTLLFLHVRSPRAWLPGSLCACLPACLRLSGRRYELLAPTV
jgi:hypothetical protein